MKPANIRRLHRVAKGANRLAAQIEETDRHGLTNDWRPFGDMRLHSLLYEFAQWYEAKAAQAEAELVGRAPVKVL